MKTTQSTFSVMMATLTILSVVTSFTNPAPVLVPKPFQNQQTRRIVVTTCSATQESDTAKEGGGINEGDDVDFHPSDDAKTTPEFLAGLWQLIARGNHMIRGVSLCIIIIFFEFDLLFPLQLKLCN